MKTFALVLSTFSLVVVGCGGGSVKAKNATDPALVGTWVTGCTSESALEATNTTYTFSEIGEMGAVDRTYPNQGCEGAATKTETTNALYSVAWSTTVPDGPRVIKVKVTDMQLPPTDDTVVPATMGIEFAITSANQIEMKIVDVSNIDKATGKSVATAPRTADDLTPITLKRKQ